MPRFSRASVIGDIDAQIRRLGEELFNTTGCRYDILEGSRQVTNADLMLRIGIEALTRANRIYGSITALYDLRHRIDSGALHE